MIMPTSMIIGSYWHDPRSSNSFLHYTVDEHISLAIF
jgi:hypothetical protein